MHKLIQPITSSTLFVLLLLMLLGACTDNDTYCKVTEPESGFAIAHGDTFTLIVDVDPDVIEVKYFIDSVGFDANNKKPFQFEVSTMNLNKSDHHLLVKAIDKRGNVAIDEISFNVTAGLPVVNTLNSEKVLQNDAKVKGMIDLNDTINLIQYGAFYSENELFEPKQISIGKQINNKGEFYAFLNNLKPATTYYYQLYSKCSLGTSFGKIKSFTTPEANYKNINYSSFYDDRGTGQIYQAVKIGSQIWMAENLAFLPEVNPSGLNTNNYPNYYVYNFEDKNIVKARATSEYKTYGVLYNYNAVKEACPTGWHIPSGAEWDQLAEFIMNSNNGTNDYDIEKGQCSWSKAAYFLKSTNAWPTDHEKNNKYGFSALPGGCLTTQGFKDMDKAAYFWTSDSYNRKFEEGGYIKCIGSHYQALSIRCVKD